MGGAHYKPVDSTDEWQRDRGIPELKKEDQILTAYKRGKLVNLIRNAVRNNSTFCTTLKQFDLHSIGTEGGKAVVSFADREYGKTVREAFAKWTRSAEFFDGLSLNTLLKLILKTEIIGGDCVVLFDDGLISDSGKVVVFETDNIGDTTPEAIEKHYGKNSYQSIGKVYTQFGQCNGVVVSMSERGRETFNPDSCYFLKKDPNGSVLDNLWIMPTNVWRPNQGRGVSQASSSITTTIDLHDYLGFELAAAKKNAQTLAQIIKTTNDSEEVTVPSAFDSDVDFSQMTDDEIEQVSKEVVDETTQTVSLNKIAAAGCIYEALPDGYKMELLQNNHPNPNSIEFVKFLSTLSAAPYGLSKSFSSLNVETSYSGFRAEQFITAPAFKEAQKFLENILDWIIYRWSIWAVRKGLIEDKFDTDWLRSISWSWPSTDHDIDEVKAQNAVALKLRNGTSTYKEILGPDWQEKLEQYKSEVEWCRQNGLSHPSLQTVSGAIVETNNSKDDSDE